MKSHYSVKEAAALLGVSTNTLYAYLESGKIQGTRVGHGRFKISHASLAAHLPETISPPSADISTPEKLEAEYISYDHGDVVFFRMLVGFLMFGISVVALVFRPFMLPSVVSRLTSISPEVISAVSTYVPIVISLIGVFLLCTVFLPGIFLAYLTPIYILAASALGYAAFVGYVSGRYEAVVLFGSFFLIVLSHLIRGVHRISRTGSFEREFWKTVCLISIGGAIAIMLAPASFPLPAARTLLDQSPMWVGVIWFAGVMVPMLLFFFLRRSTWYDLIVLPAVIVVQGCLGVLFATQAKWAVFYGSELLITFTVFLVWWRRSRPVLTRSSISFMYLALGWVMLVLLLGILGMNFAQKYHVTSQVEKMKFVLSEAARDMTDSVDTIDRHLASAGNEKELLTVLKKGDRQDVVAFARHIYDRIPNMRRIALVSKDGMGLGSYPIDLRSATVSSDVATRDYFIETKRTLTPYTSAVFQSRLAAPIVVRTYPVIADDVFVGMILAIPDLTGLSSAYKTISQDVDVYSFDASGAHTIHPNPTLIGSEVSKDIRAAKDHEVHQTIHTIHVFKTLSSPPWTLYAEIPLQTVLGRVSELVVLFSLIIGVNSFVTLSFMFLLLTKWKNR